jgi:hypothetical protein
MKGHVSLVKTEDSIFQPVHVFWPFTFVEDLCVGQKLIISLHKGIYYIDLRSSLRMYESAFL